MRGPLSRDRTGSCVLLAEEDPPTPSVPPRPRRVLAASSPLRSTPIRYYGVLRLRFVFALPGDDLSMSTSRLFSLGLSASLLLSWGVPEAHLEGRGIPDYGGGGGH